MVVGLVDGETARHDDRQEAADDHHPAHHQPVVLQVVVIGRALAQTGAEHARQVCCRNVLCA